MIVSPTSIETAFRLVREGRLAELAARTRHRLSPRLFEESVAFGLKRDLALPWTAPEARIPITVREAVASDADRLFALDEPGISESERLERVWRRVHFEKAVPTCYVAIDARDGTPCYVQWLMTSASNAEIQTLGAFPILREHEALLENAYTPPAHRGLGIMAAAMARIAEKGEAHGIREVMTFVAQDNVASLKGCERAGFAPFTRRIITGRFFNIHRSVAYRPLDDTPPAGRR